MNDEAREKEKAGRFAHSPAANESLVAEIRRRAELRPRMLPEPSVAGTGEEATIKEA
jgi:hypothetical protein